MRTQTSKGYKWHVSKNKVDLYNKDSKKFYRANSLYCNKRLKYFILFFINNILQNLASHTIKLLHVCLTQKSKKIFEDQFLLTVNQKFFNHPNIILQQIYLHHSSPKITMPFYYVTMVLLNS